MPGISADACSGSSGSNSFFHWAHGWTSGEHWTTHQIRQSSAWAGVQVNGHGSVVN